MLKTNHKTFILLWVLNIFFTCLTANTLILLRSEANIPPITLSHDEPKKKYGVRIGQSQQSHYTRTSNQSLQTHYQDLDTPEICVNLQRYFAWQQAIEQERLAIAIENSQKAQALEAAKTPEMRAQEAAKAEEERVIQILASKPRLTNNKQELGNYLNTLQQYAQEPIAFDTDKTTARIKALEATVSNGGAMRNYRTEVPHYNLRSDPDSDEDYSAIFSNTYGTELDLQLHKELVTTRYHTQTLESSFSQNIHVQIIGPAIHKIASDSKQERDIKKAFTLADFCADLFTCLELGFNNINRARYAFANGINKVDQIISRIEQAIDKGSSTGIDVFLSPQHWYEMMTGFINIGKFLYGEVKDRADFISTIFDRAERDKQLMKIIQKKLDRIDAFLNFACASTEKLKAMSWERRVEKSAEIGTICMLDGVVFHILGYAAQASAPFVKNVANAMRSPASMEYAAEVAGIGKLALEEGAHFSENVLPAMLQDTEFIGSKILGNSVSERLKRFVSRFKTKNNQKIFATGGREITVAEYAAEEAWVKKQYELIRQTTDDVQKIAQNTGMPEFKIRTIKNHLFEDTHFLQRQNKIARFDPARLTLETWNRFIKNTFTEIDLVLLEHEYFESKFEKIFRTSYETAHAKANLKHNWETLIKEQK